MTTPRMPPLRDDEMTPEQRQAAREISAGRRGELSGPFVPALRSPEFTRRLQRLGEYMRYDSALPPRVRELVILLTARAFDQGYEWHVHEPLARQAGLSSDVIAAIAARVRPAGLSDDETVAYDFVAELRDDRAVGDELYSRAVAAFGEQGVIDLIGTVGYYGTLAMIMNVARVPVPGSPLT